MNYADIKLFDIANGPGVRVSLFVSGCRRNCKGCFNREAWDFCYGKPFDEEAEQIIFDGLAKSFNGGFTVLGGEPFEPENRECIAALLEKIRAKYPEKSIWCFSGFDFEKDILKMAEEDRGGTDAAGRMLSCIDFLVDGPFVEEQKSLALRFKGSANQRIIDVKATLQAGETLRWAEDVV